MTEKKQTWKERLEVLKGRRQRGIYRAVECHRQRVAERLKGSRKLFGKKVFCVDPHTHSSFSDGAGTVKTNAEWAALVGLDYIFATDHDTTKARGSVGKLRNASWGEETCGGGYDVGMLEPLRTDKYRAGRTVAETWFDASLLSDFTWIAHPIWQNEPMEEEKYNKVLADMDSLGDFAMEMLNGCTDADRAFHWAGEPMIRLFDELLTCGHKVTALGVSDAHYVVDIGTAFTGVFAEKCTSRNLMATLAAGTCFASECPLLDFSVNNKPMGSVLARAKGKPARIKARVVDSAGIQWVRLVSNGKVIKEFWPRSEKCVDIDITRKMPAGDSYFRIDVAAIDNRRAFSTPVYVRP